MEERYRTSNWYFSIVKIYVTRETEKSYYVSMGGAGECRHLKDHNYHQTWEGARNYLLDRTERRLNTHKEDVKRSEKDLATVAAMIKPV